MRVACSKSHFSHCSREQRNTKAFGISICKQPPRDAFGPARLSKQVRYVGLNPLTPCQLVADSAGPGLADSCVFALTDENIPGGVIRGSEWHSHLGSMKVLLHGTGLFLSAKQPIKSVFVLMSGQNFLTPAALCKAFLKPLFL